MIEISYNNGVIYQLKNDFFCLIKDKIGFSQCFHSLDQAKNEYNDMIARNERNKFFNIEQEKRIHAENEQEQKREQEQKTKKQQENENHVIKALDEIMKKDSFLITELYYKDDKSNKTITIKHIKDTKTFQVKFSRNKEIVLYYSEVLKKLVSIRNMFPCGKWYKF